LRPGLAGIDNGLRHHTFSHDCHHSRARLGIETIGAFRLPEQTDLHLQSLMDRNNDGLLQPSEKEELAALAALSEEISLLRAEALQLLGKQPS
jgi:hypothetical protein